MLTYCQREERARRCSWFRCINTSGHISDIYSRYVCVIMCLTTPNPTIPIMQLSDIYSVITCLVFQTLQPRFINVIFCQNYVYIKFKITLMTSLWHHQGYLSDFRMLRYLTLFKNYPWKMLWESVEILLQICKIPNIVHPHCSYLIQTQTVLNSLNKPQTKGSMQLVILVYKLTYWPQFDDYRLRIFFFGGHMGEWWRPQCDEQLDTAQTGSVLTEEEWRAVSHDIVERMGAVWRVSKPRRGEEGRGGVGSRSKALWVGFLRGEKVWGFWRRAPDGHVSHASVSATMQRPTKCVRAGLNTAAVGVNTMRSHVLVLHITRVRLP